MEINVFVGLINIPYSNVSLALLHTNIFYKMPHLTGLLLFVMLVLVRGDPAFTKTEVIGLDILAPRHPKLYSLIVGRLGYDINTNTNIVSNRQGNVDESCQPDATGRQICLKVCDFLTRAIFVVAFKFDVIEIQSNIYIFLFQPFMYPTDVVNILLETGGFLLNSNTCQGNSILVWSLIK